MNHKKLSVFLIALNILGICCLIYFAIPLILNDSAVPNPDAMLPLERWDGGGAALTLGLLPLTAVNILGVIFIARGQLKKSVRALFMLPSVLCTLLVVYYMLLSFNVIPGFFPKIPVAKVALLDHETQAESCCLVYDDGKYLTIDEFECDPIQIYTADDSCFESYIDDDTVRNRLNHIQLTDESGAPVEADEKIRSLMNCAARELEHDLWLFQIIRDGKDDFVFVKLNVNWSDPCDLYRYDPGKDTLVHLCRWQNADFKGIRVLQEWEESD